MTDHDVMPPHNPDAEEALIGACLLDGVAALELADRVQADEFYDPNRGAVWAAVQRLVGSGQQPDMVLVVQDLRERGELEKIGGVAAIARCMQDVPDAGNADAYATLVTEHADRRKLQRVAQELLRAVSSPGVERSHELLERAQDVVFRGAEQLNRRGGSMSVADVAGEVFDRALEPPPDGGRLQRTGFLEVDELLGGMRDGGLYVVAGRPSMGKSSWALQVLANVTVRRQQPGALYTLEVQREDVVDQLMRQDARLDSEVCGNGLDASAVARLDEARGRLASSQLVVDDDKRLTLPGLVARTKLQHLRCPGGLRLVVVDYLQLLRLGRRVESRVQEVGELSRELKHLAGELSCPLIVLSQLNRQVEQRDDKRPRMSDLRESGSIEQDADAVLLLYREGYYDDRADDTMAEVIVAKNRHGRTGTASVHWDGPTRRFLDGAAWMAEAALAAPNEPPTVPSW